MPWGLESGVQLGDQSQTCSSKWCGLYLCLWSLLGLQGRADRQEDDQVGGFLWVIELVLGE